MLNYKLSITAEMSLQSNYNISFKIIFPSQANEPKSISVGRQCALLLKADDRCHK